MPEIDVASSIAGGTEDDQKKQGTHIEHLAHLRQRFRELEELDAAGPEEFRAVCGTLLRAFEGVRVEQDRHIRNYETKIAYCRATQQSCSMFAHLLVGILATKVQEATRGASDDNGQSVSPPPISDTEMLKQICVCACVDDKDIAQCDCTCHDGTPCEAPRCVVCAAKRLEMAAAKKIEESSHNALMCKKCNRSYDPEKQYKTCPHKKRKSKKKT